jgi:hypothetical protein
VIVTELTNPAAAERARAERKAQGLAPTVTDPAALASLAATMRAAHVDIEAAA